MERRVTTFYKVCAESCLYKFPLMYDFRLKNNTWFPILYISFIDLPKPTQNKMLLSLFTILIHYKITWIFCCPKYLWNCKIQFFSLDNRVVWINEYNIVANITPTNVKKSTFSEFQNPCNPNEISEGKFPPDVFNKQPLFGPTTAPAY